MAAKELYSTKWYSDANLKAYYRLEDNANDSKGSHNGSATGMSYATGLFGKAGSFNGSSSRIDIPQHSYLQPTNKMTVGHWAKYTGDGYVTWCNFWYGNVGAGDGASGWALGLGAKKAVFNIANNTVAGGITIFGTTDINDNAWHFVVGTFDKPDVKIYVDGALEDTDSWNYDIAYNASAKCLLGCRYIFLGYQLYYPGLLDDVFIMNGYAMTAAEVKNLYSPITPGFFIFLSEAWQRHKKLWTPKGLILPEDLGFAI